MKKKTILELNFPFIFIFCKGVKENQGLKEANMQGLRLAGKLH